MSKQVTEERLRAALARFVPDDPWYQPDLGAGVEWDPLECFSCRTPKPKHKPDCAWVNGREALAAPATFDPSTVILVETSGSEPELTTKLRGDEVEVINIDWDEVERGTNPDYIRDILDRIFELDVRHIKPPNHIGMPEIVRQLIVRLREHEQAAQELAQLSGKEDR